MCPRGLEYYAREEHTLEQEGRLTMEQDGPRTLRALVAVPVPPGDKDWTARCLQGEERQTARGREGKARLAPESGRDSDSSIHGI